MGDGTEKIEVIGVGSPIVDTLVQVENAVVHAIGGEKGGMELVDAEWMGQTLAMLEGTHIEAPGGSAGNTVAGLLRLGTSASFLGKIGNDIGGEFYLDRFRLLGADTSRFKVGDVANGRCLSLVTPDSERTMRTHLGAAMTLSPDEVTVADFTGVRHAHIEGYLLFNRALLYKVLKSANAAHCSISLDLASFETVEAAKDILPDLLNDYIDIVFANEEEAAAYFDGKGECQDWAKQLAGLCSVAAVKRGKDGAVLSDGQAVVSVAAQKVQSVVDTTGAGDLWAAGFLHGWLGGAPLERCGEWGSLLAGEVIQVMGAEIPTDRWKSIQQLVGR